MLCVQKQIQDITQSMTEKNRLIYDTQEARIANSFASAGAISMTLPNIFFLLKLLYSHSYLHMVLLFSPLLQLL